jgi:hypothetical protein
MKCYAKKITENTYRNERMANHFNSALSGAGRQIVHSDYVTLMRQRALGELPDMGCAVRLSEILKDLVLAESKNGSIDKLIDVGCAAGHYYRTLTTREVPIGSYVGLEVNPEMVSAASEVWRDEIKGGRVKFILDDVESSIPLEQSEIIICYNSFMYYKSARLVLRKFLDSASTLIIRSYFSDSNYRILRGQCRQNNDAVSLDELDIFTDAGELSSGDYWTIYSFTYIERLLRSLEPRAKVTWLKDNNAIASIEAEAKMGINKRGGTQVVNGYEISYPLLQPWEIALITVE